MKTELEIQEVHDKLTAIILSEVPNPFAPDKKFKGDTATERIMMEQCAVLCWILGHDHNPAFGENLAKIDQTLTRMAYTLERKNN